MRFLSFLTVTLTLPAFVAATSACSDSGSSAPAAGAPGNGGAPTGATGGSGNPLAGAAGVPAQGGASSGASPGGAGPTAGALGGGGVPASAGAGGAVAGVAGAQTSAGAGGVPAAPGDDTCSPTPRGLIAFSRGSGTFEGSIEVGLSTEVPDAEIRYTLDHTAPSATSPAYDGQPLVFTSTTELRARAFVGGAPVGAAAVAVYVARAFDRAHDLPLMVLDSYGQALPVPPMMGGVPGPAMPVDRTFKDVAVLTFEESASNSLSAAPTIATAGGFHLRGQSSAAYPKRPYRLETRDATTADRDCPLLGMPAESDWVLHAPYPDKALIRNAFVYSLGPDVGIAAPRAKLVELYVNSEARPLQATDYQGVYLLVETIKNQKHRLNLQQLDETDTALPAIGGGYIFKFEWRVTDIEQRLMCPATQTRCWDWLEVSDPEPWIAPQQDFLTQYVNTFVDALHSVTPSDPMTGYPAYIDTASWVNQVIVQELTRNMDAYVRSQFFHKDRDGKIVAGPLWDYDLTAGVGLTSGTFANTAVEGWQYEANASRLTGTSPESPGTADWFPVLVADPAFRAALVARWKELRLGALSDAAVTARIAALTAGLGPAAERNFEKWPVLTTTMLGYFQTPVLPTWQEHVAAMQAWLLARAAWLDSQWQ